jgi:hypothetical protein
MISTKSIYGASAYGPVAPRPCGFWQWLCLQAREAADADFIGGLLQCRCCRSLCWRDCQECFPLYVSNKNPDFRSGEANRLDLLEVKQEARNLLQ